MADTVDTAASLPPADEAERSHDARSAPVDGEAEGPQKEAGETDGQKDAAGEPDGRDKEAEEPEEPRSLTELFEQLGRELSDLGLSEAQLEAARNMPEVRRAARDIVGALVVVIAGLTAFALLNVAALDGLSKVLATWLAAMVLAAVWTGIAGVLLFGLMGRARRWLSWILVKAPPNEALEELERERNAAGRAALTTIEQLGPAIALQIALAAIPKPGDVAEDMASGVVEVGDNVIEASDEFVEMVTEQLPGGGVVNQVWDVALAPGRLGVKVATTVLRRGRPGEVSDHGGGRTGDETRLSHSPK